MILIMQKYKKNVDFYISVIKINDETFVADQFYKGIYFLISKDMDITTILDYVAQQSNYIHKMSI